MRYKVAKFMSTCLLTEDESVGFYLTQFVGHVDIKRNAELNKRIVALLNLAESLTTEDIETAVTVAQLLILGKKRS